MFKLQLLLMMNIVVMIDGSRSFILHGYNPNQTEWFTIRYPYKNIYGLPNSLNCHQSIYEEFDECEQSSHKDWQITIDEYFYETKKFCCFIWQTMDCEIDKAKKCNQIYSLEIEFNTRKTYQTFCDHIGYSHGSWTCWWTENRIITVSSVIGAALVILTIFCIAYGFYKYNNRSKNKVDEQMNFTKLKRSSSLSSTKTITPSSPPPPSTTKMGGQQITEAVSSSIRSSSGSSKGSNTIKSTKTTATILTESSSTIGDGQQITKTASSIRSSSSGLRSSSGSNSTSNTIKSTSTTTTTILSDPPPPPPTTTTNIVPQSITAKTRLSSPAIITTNDYSTIPINNINQTNNNQNNNNNNGGIVHATLHYVVSNDSLNFEEIPLTSTPTLPLSSSRSIASSTETEKNPKYIPKRRLSHPFNIISDEDYYAECWLETQSDSGIAPFRYKQFRQSNILNVGGGGESSTSAAIPPPPPPPPSSQATVPTPTLTDIQKIIQQNYINTALQDFKPF
uniref:Mucin-5AC-like n=1 Tax=Dermatophagoides pteronyssinus TaxID=6956 RepID=A0A6P6Y738_DERPT|nr:mucin-5AC-like [Dermatophagoides pteronyssinus]